MIILTLKKQYLNWKSIFHPRKKFPILTKNKQCSKQKNVLYLSEKNFPNQNKYYFTSSIKQFSKWRKFLKFVREKQNFLCISEQKISHTVPLFLTLAKLRALVWAWIYVWTLNWYNYFHEELEQNSVTAKVYI